MCLASFCFRLLAKSHINVAAYGVTMVTSKSISVSWARLVCIHMLSFNPSQRLGRDFTTHASHWRAAVSAGFCFWLRDESQLNDSIITTDSKINNKHKTRKSIPLFPTRSSHINNLFILCLLFTFTNTHPPPSTPPSLLPNKCLCYVNMRLIHINSDTTELLRLKLVTINNNNNNNTHIYRLLI